MGIENEQGTRVNGARNSGGFRDEGTRCGSAKRGLGECCFTAADEILRLGLNLVLIEA